MEKKLLKWRDREVVSLTTKMTYTEIERGKETVSPAAEVEHG